MSVEDKLNQLKTIIESLPYVQRGDYISSDHHNKIVDALKLIQEIIEEVKDTASLYIPINAPHDPFKVISVFNNYLWTKHTIYISGVKSLFVINKPRSKLFSRQRTIITPSTSTDFKKLIDDTEFVLNYSASTNYTRIQEAVAELIILAGFRVTSDDMEIISDILNYAYSSYGISDPLFYILSIGVEHANTNFYGFNIKPYIDRNKNMVFKVEDLVANTTQVFSIYPDEWYYFVAYSNPPSSIGMVILYDENLGILKEITLTTESIENTYAYILTDIEKIYIDTSNLKFEAYGAGVDYILVQRT